MEIEGRLALIGQTESHRQIVEKNGWTLSVDLLLQFPLAPIPRKANEEENQGDAHGDPGS